MFFLLQIKLQQMDLMMMEFHNEYINKSSYDDDNRSECQQFINHASYSTFRILQIFFAFINFLYVTEEHYVKLRYVFFCECVNRTVNRWRSKCEEGGVWLVFVRNDIFNNFETF